MFPGLPRYPGVEDTAAESKPVWARHTMTVDERQTCQSCGEPVTTAVAGLCPRCLLGGALGGEAAVDSDEARTVAADTSLHAPPPADGGRPAARRPAPATLAPADQPARLQILEEIDHGGMGIVLRGRDPELRRDLAVKVLRDELRDDPDMVRRFVEEAQIAGQLQHPGVVPVHELGALDDGRPYFTMKLVKGRTLSQILKAGASSGTDPARLLGIFEQVCQTVAYAHSHRVIHRDLKPSNVMIGGFGEVQVMDWGLAKVLARGAADVAAAGRTDGDGTVIATARSGSADSDLSRAGSVLGTPSYMAPEQARGEVDRVDERADVFALGSILSEILTGHPAYVGPSSGAIQRKAARGDTADALAAPGLLGEADAELVRLAVDRLPPEPEHRPRGRRRRRGAG